MSRKVGARGAMHDNDNCPGIEASARFVIAEHRSGRMRCHFGGAPMTACTSNRRHFICRHSPAPAYHGRQVLG